MQGLQHSKLAWERNLPRLLLAATYIAALHMLSDVVASALSSSWKISSKAVPAFIPYIN